MPKNYHIFRYSHEVSTVCVLALSTLFFFAFAIKFFDAPSFRNNVGMIVVGVWPGEAGIPQLVRYPGVNLATTFVLAWEATLALAILFPSTRRIGLAAGITTLLCFIGVLVVILFLPDPPACGCLGGVGTSSENATLDASIGIVRNPALIAVAFWTLRYLQPRQVSDGQSATEQQCA